MYCPVGREVSSCTAMDTTLLYHVGCKVAVDVSMCLYQFLIAVRSEGMQLVGSDGETTR